MDSACAAQLRSHLVSTYGVAVSQISSLDAGVFKVDRNEGPSWVARVFPETRPHDGASGDVAILRALERSGFPAERCATAAPVSVLDGRDVLVTEFVTPAPPLQPRGRTHAILGALLGRLHSHPGEGLRAGGAWHHLSFTGTPRSELAAARAMLEAAQSRVGLRELSLYHRLCDAVERTDDCEDLPHAFVHADFVPANAVPTAQGDLVIVDWAGSGRGPRLWSLGFLLWAAGVRSPKLVDVVVSRYSRNVALRQAEFDRLAGAIRARPVMLECWSFCAGRRELGEAAARIEEAERQAPRIAEVARRAFAPSS